MGPAGESGLGSNGHEGVLCIHSLITYLEHPYFRGGLTPLQEIQSVNSKPS